MKNIKPDFSLAHLPLWQRGIKGDSHLRATRIRPVIRVTLAGLLLTAVAAANAEPLGRLFFTPQQRALLEHGQHLDMEKPKKDQPEDDKPEIIDSLTVDGIVQKHGGERTVWINGVPQITGRSDERAPESVSVAIPGQSQPVRIKVGQKVLLNPNTPQETEIRTTPPKPGDD